MARAPLRISLAGGGTDLPSYSDVYSGRVVTMAINRSVVVAVHAANFFGSVRASLEQAETVPSAHDLHNDFARAALIREGVTNDLQVSSFSDAPSGTGLGGSGAFTVALLHALRRLRAADVNRLELAEDAAAIEMVDLGRPVGKQDHYASAVGGLQMLSFAPTGAVTVEPLDATGIEADVASRLHLFYTGRSRDAGQVLTAQAATTRGGDDATVGALHAIGGLVPAMQEALATRNWDQAGEVLHEHWMQKKTLSDGVSSPHVDQLYDVARREGAVGGKLVGAGGGGFLLLVSRQAEDARLRSALSKLGLAELDFGFSRSGTEAISFEEGT